jgi:uncharacterized protein (TIGR01440 family)
MEDYIVQIKNAVTELIEVSRLRKGQILVVGCSTSEITGNRIGSNSVPEVAENIYAVIKEILDKKGIYLAAQCCEHLNRALIIERELADKLGLDTVNAVPQPKAGGSFATAAYKGFTAPAAVEHIRADAGLDMSDAYRNAS